MIITNIEDESVYYYGYAYHGLLFKREGQLKKVRRIEKELKNHIGKLWEEKQIPW